MGTGTGSAERPHPYQTPGSGSADGPLPYQTAEFIVPYTASPGKGNEQTNAAATGQPLASTSPIPFDPPPKAVPLTAPLAHPNHVRDLVVAPASQLPFMKAPPPAHFMTTPAKPPPLDRSGQSAAVHPTTTGSAEGTAPAAKAPPFMLDSLDSTAHPPPELKAPPLNLSCTVAAEKATPAQAVRAPTPAQPKVPQGPHSKTLRALSNSA